jgi:hypothetical protein
LGLKVGQLGRIVPLNKSAVNTAQGEVSRVARLLLNVVANATEGGTATSKKRYYHGYTKKEIRDKENGGEETSGEKIRDSEKTDRKSKR